MRVRHSNPPGTSASEEFADVGDGRLKPILQADGGLPTGVDPFKHCRDKMRFRSLPPGNARASRRAPCMLRTVYQRGSAVCSSRSKTFRRAIATP